MVRRVGVGVNSTRATADLDLEHRRKGLLWYATYTVAFKGTYTFRNPDSVERLMGVRLPLPAENALFDDFVFTVNGQPAALAGDVSKEMVATVTVAPDAVVTLDVGYRSRGLGTWTYAFVPAATGTARVRDFQLAVDTNVVDIDFPAGSMSPTQRTRTADGWRVQWTFTNLLSGQAIGVTLPEKLNPGPFAARVTFFAPVGLLFFLSVMVILGATSGPVAAPDALLVRGCRLLRLPSPAGLPGRSRAGARGIRHLGRGQPGAGGQLPAARHRDASRPPSGRRGTGRVPGALQLRVLFRGIHGAGHHHRRGDHALRADADHGARVVGRRYSPAAHRIRLEGRSFPMPAVSDAYALESPAPAVQHKTLTVHTVHPMQFLDLTRLIEAAVQHAGLYSGIVNVQTRHTTTGILINEHEPLLLADFRAMFERMAPARASYAHDDFARRTVNLTPDERRNGHAHCRAALLRSSETLSVRQGLLELGRWQRVIFVEFDGGPAPAGGADDDRGASADAKTLSPFYADEEAGLGRMGRRLSRSPTT